MKKIRYPDNQCQITQRQPVINRSRCSYSPFKEQTKTEHYITASRSQQRYTLDFRRNTLPNSANHRSGSHGLFAYRKGPSNSHQTTASHSSAITRRPQPRLLCNQSKLQLRIWQRHFNGGPAPQSDASTKPCYRTPSAVSFIARPRRIRLHTTQHALATGQFRPDAIFEVRKLTPA